MYKIDKKWFTKDNRKGSVDTVVLNGRKTHIGWQKVLIRNVERIRGVLPEDQKTLKYLYAIGKEYVTLADDKPKKVQRATKVKLVDVKNILKRDEPKDINQESEEVSIQEKED